jgi:hypothetical protein
MYGAGGMANRVALLAVLAALLAPSDVNGGVLSGAALRALWHSYTCINAARAPRLAIRCHANCAVPPKALSAQELTALGAAPNRAPEFSRFSIRLSDDWHHACDRKTS